MINDYEEAMRKMEQHLHRNPDGTFHLDLVDGSSLGIDPVIFADLKRSLDVTNRLIQRGEIRPEDIETGEMLHTVYPKNEENL